MNTPAPTTVPPPPCPHLRVGDTAIFRGRIPVKVVKVFLSHLTRRWMAVVEDDGAGGLVLAAELVVTPRSDDDPSHYRHGL